MRALGVILTLGTAAPVWGGGALSEAEMAQFRHEVQACWLVREADAPTVTLGIKMHQNGTPDVQSVRLVRPVGSTSEEIEAAFAAAKRAVLRCGSDGYTLPVEKYAQWRDIELTFDPERTISR